MRSDKPRHFTAKKLAGDKMAYYWQPSKVAKEAGFKAVALGKDLVVAVKKAEKINREWDRVASGEFLNDAHDIGTMPWLVAHYKASAHFRLKLKPKTRKSYEWPMSEILKWSQAKTHPYISGLTRQNVKDFHAELLDDGSEYKAAAIMRVLRLLLSYGCDLGELKQNPATRQRIKTPLPRSVIWTSQDVQAFQVAAMSTGRVSVWLGVLLGLDTTQRLSDVLALKWSDIENGRFSVTQSKTNRKVSVRLSEWLRAALSGVEATSTYILVNENTNRPYDINSWGKAFRQIREIAKLDKNLQFRDLRRTAVVDMMGLNLTDNCITAVTGHSKKSAQTILETYGPRTESMADQAIRARDKARRNR